MTPNSGLLRVVFVLVVAQAMLLGSALVWPELISLVLPWPASPLNARFVACLYLMGAASALLGAMAPRYAEVRISLVQVLAITGCLQLLTLPHLGEFDAAGFPYRWLVFYTLDVVVIGAILLRWRGRDRAPGGGAHHPAAPLLLAYAAVTAVAGAVLLVAPGFAVQVWPWSLTPILAQVYSVFFLVFALGAWLAAWDARPEAGRISVAANLVMLVLVLTVSVANLDRFAAGPRTAVWFGLFGAAAAVLAVVLSRGRSGALAREATR
jgi:hypothetical protein